MRTLIYLNFLFYTWVAFASQPGLYGKDGVFLEGYDPVSYLTMNKAIKGKKEFSLKYQKKTIYFSSKEHQLAFLNNPTKYIPAFNGWCAYAMAKDGSVVEVDPETFKIINGKVHLFYNWFLINTKTKWEEEFGGPNEKQSVEAAKNFWKML